MTGIVEIYRRWPSYSVGPATMTPEFYIREGNFGRWAMCKDAGRPTHEQDDVAAVYPSKSAARTALRQKELAS